VGRGQSVKRLFASACLYDPYLNELGYAYNSETSHFLKPGNETEERGW